MMYKKKFLIILISILLLTNFPLLSDERAFIVFDVNDQIITNIDIEKESRYLTTLNVQLKKLNPKKVLNISKESALREKIKEIELLKYFDLKEKNPLTERYIEDFYLRLKLTNKIELSSLLNSYGLSMEYVENKINIELTWNQLIYEKYRDQVNIDVNKIKNKISKNKSTTKKKIYQLSEIVFEVDSQINLNNKLKNINESIKEIGFKNTANIYSVANSAKFGGEIGWVEEERLSKKIMEELKKRNINEITLPFQTDGSFVILKIDNIKYEEKIIDEKAQLEKIIQFQTDKQLERFSKIYYNKLKINTSINES
jgi:peptidyl-prolyl cis-trans isomerase SurA